MRTKKTGEATDTQADQTAEHALSGLQRACPTQSGGAAPASARQRGSTRAPDGVVYRRADAREQLARCNLLRKVARSESVTLPSDKRQRAPIQKDDVGKGVG
eukprot:4355240-Pleurochrysis_carterae.AAC.1